MPTEPVDESGGGRPGWAKYNGKWVPAPKPVPPAVPLKPVDLAAIDDSLEASHKRITRVLAVQSTRLEQSAVDGTLTSDNLKELDALASVWRTLEANVGALAEKAIEKAIKRELARLGPNEQEEEHGDERASDDDAPGGR